MSAPLIFTHVPRTGGTSVNVSLAPFYEGRRFTINTRNELASSIEDIRRVWSRAPFVHGHFRLVDLDEHALPGGMQVFSIVREPVERMVSFFCFCEKHGEHAMPSLWRQTNGKGLAYFVSFGLDAYPEAFRDQNCYWIGSEPTAASAIASIEARYSLVADQDHLRDAVRRIGDLICQPTELIATPQNAGRAGAPIEDFLTPALRSQIEAVSVEDRRLLDFIGDAGGIWGRPGS